MTFSLPPRQQYNHYSHHGHGRHHPRNRMFGLGSGHHAIDKARSADSPNHKVPSSLTTPPDMSTPTTDSSLTLAATTTPKASTPTFTSTGATSCRSSSR